MSTHRANRSREIVFADVGRKDVRAGRIGRSPRIFAHSPRPPAQRRAPVPLFLLTQSSWLLRPDSNLCQGRCKAPRATLWAGASRLFYMSLPSSRGPVYLSLSCRQCCHNSSLAAAAVLCRPVEVSSRPRPGRSFRAFRHGFIPTSYELPREGQNLLGSCWRWVRDAKWPRVN